MLHVSIRQKRGPWHTRKKNHSKQGYHATLNVLPKQFEKTDRTSVVDSLMIKMGYFCVESGMSFC